MAARIFENHVTAELNKAVPVSQPLQPVESIGPVSLLMFNQGTAACVVQAKKQSDGTVVATDKDTVNTDEDTAYDGDTSALVFSGQVLNVLPIVPGTVTVKPTAGGDSVNGTDRDGDGKLFTADVDEDFMGTVDYFTGALELTYPAGKAPNTTNILCTYTSQDSTLIGGGRKNYQINNVLQGDAVIPAVACDDAGGSFVKIEAIATWI